MKSYLIKDTTREERERIVSESVGQIEAACDGSAGRYRDVSGVYRRGKGTARDQPRICCALYLRPRGTDAKRMWDVLTIIILILVKMA